MTCYFTQFAVLKFPYNDYLKSKLEKFVNLVELEKMKPGQDLEKKKLEGEMDPDIEREIGVVKGAIEQLMKR